MSSSRYPRRSSRIAQRISERVSFAYELDLDDDEEELEHFVPVTRYDDDDSEEEESWRSKRAAKKRSRKRQSKSAFVRRKQRANDEEEEEAAAEDGGFQQDGSDFDEDDDEEDLVECDECGYLIGALSAYFHCRECEEEDASTSFDLCESCYFETEGASHAHQLDYIRARPDDKPLYSVQDPMTKHWVHLGAYASALLDSATLAKLKIGAVLSLMCIEDIDEVDDGDEAREEEPRGSLRQLTEYLSSSNTHLDANDMLLQQQQNNQQQQQQNHHHQQQQKGLQKYSTRDLAESSDTSVEALLQVFGRGAEGYRQTVNAGPRGIVYHHINLPDLADPKLLRENGVEFVLEEATLLMDMALKRTNVLVHCQFGQRRSPSVLMAWMMTKGFTLKHALRSINLEYRASTNWAEGYCRRRRLWISKLVEWRKGHRELQRAWFEGNRDKVQAWAQHLRAIEETALNGADKQQNNAKRSRHL